MRKLLLFCFVVFGRSANAQEIDVLRYLFSIWVSDHSDTIKGVTSIRLVIKKPGEAKIDLTGINKNGKGMSVSEVRSYNDRDVFSIPYTQTSDAVVIPTNHHRPGDTISVTIVYEGIPDNGLIISKNKYGDKTFFADNWPNRAHHWVPCIDKPDDKASFEFVVHAPAQYGVVSNGAKIEEIDAKNGMKLTRWKEDIPSPTKVMVIGVAKFATKVFEDSPKDVPVSAWVYPQDSAKGFYDYAVTTEIVKFFSDYIAPFPYKKLANVQSKTIFGGMENASCIFYAESSVTGDRSEEDLYAHEIAHQWFGDMASEKSFAHLWLSEGFATYMTDIYFEQKYGKEAFNKRLQKERDEAIAFAKTSTHSVVDSTTDLMSLLNANSYQKGAWVLHMLRGEVGDSTFHKIIQAYYNQYKGGNADTRDFEVVAERVSGKDLKWFFDQWLYRPGNLRLKIKTVQTDAGLLLSVEQLQKDLYDFHLPVSVETTTTKEKIGLIHITERNQSLKLSNGKMIKVGIDPNNQLLFEEAK